MEKSNGNPYRELEKNYSKSYISVASIFCIAPVNAFDARRWFWTPPKAVSVLMHDEMQSVSCLAPIWNSTEWVEKPYIVTVKGFP